MTSPHHHLIDIGDRERRWQRANGGLNGLGVPVEAWPGAAAKEALRDAIRTSFACHESYGEAVRALGEIERRLGQFDAIAHFGVTAVAPYEAYDLVDWLQPLLSGFGLRGQRRALLESVVDDLTAHAEEGYTSAVTSALTPEGAVTSVLARHGKAYLMPDYDRGAASVEDARRWVFYCASNGVALLDQDGALCADWLDRAVLTLALSLGLLDPAYGEERPWLAQAGYGWLVRLGTGGDWYGQWGLLTDHPNADAAIAAAWAELQATLPGLFPDQFEAVRGPWFAPAPSDGGPLPALPETTH